MRDIRCLNRDCLAEVESGQIAQHITSYASTMVYCPNCLISGKYNRFGSHKCINPFIHTIVSNWNFLMKFWNNIGVEVIAKVPFKIYNLAKYFHSSSIIIDFFKRCHNS